MRIGELSAQSGVSQRSLRYYEQLGLIDAERQSNGYRDYEESMVERAGVIHLLFDMGFARDVVTSVLACSGEAAPKATHDDLAVKLTAVREQLNARIDHLSTARERIDDFLLSR